MPTCAALQTADVVVDALLGTGVSRPIEATGRDTQIVKEEIEARRALPSEPESGLGHPLLFPIGELSLWARRSGSGIPSRMTIAIGIPRTNWTAKKKTSRARMKRRRLSP